MLITILLHLSSVDNYESMSTTKPATTAVSSNIESFPLSSTETADEIEDSNGYMMLNSANLCHNSQTPSVGMKQNTVQAV